MAVRGSHARDMERRLTVEGESNRGMDDAPHRSYHAPTRWMVSIAVRTERRSGVGVAPAQHALGPLHVGLIFEQHGQRVLDGLAVKAGGVERDERARPIERLGDAGGFLDRKSTRLNSSHQLIS